MIFLKKFLISLSIILALLFIEKDKIVIPKESIRIRVIANSNSEYDQKVKMDVRDILENELYYILKDKKKLSDARLAISSELPKIDSQIANYLKTNKYSEGYNINFGYNYFPEKEYKGIKYKEGIYESLLITLGEGKGKNWWCVMFPPFCLIEAKESDTSEVEYRWAIKDLINKYLK